MTSEEQPAVEHIEERLTMLREEQSTLLDKSRKDNELFDSQDVGSFARNIARERAMILYGLDRQIASEDCRAISRLFRSSPLATHHGVELRMAELFKEKAALMARILAMEMSADGYEVVSKTDAVETEDVRVDELADDWVEVQETGGGWVNVLAARKS
jgi:hypothetical protein